MIDMLEIARIALTTNHLSRERRLLGFEGFFSSFAKLQYCIACKVLPSTSAMPTKGWKRINRSGEYQCKKGIQRRVKSNPEALRSYEDHAVYHYTIDVSRPCYTNVCSRTNVFA